MKRALVTMAALGLVAGCGGGGGEETAAADAESTPAVSMQTTCDMLFVADQSKEYKNGLWSKATAVVVAASNHSAWAEDEAAVADELRQIAASAKPKIRSHIETMADAASAPRDADYDAYELAAREVANQCTAYVALGM